MLNLSAPNLSGRPPPAAASQSSFQVGQGPQLPLSRSGSNASLYNTSGAGSRQSHMGPGSMRSTSPYMSPVRSTAPSLQPQTPPVMSRVDGDVSYSSSARSLESYERGPSLTVPGLGLSMGPGGHAPSPGLSSAHMAPGPLERKPDDFEARHSSLRDPAGAASAASAPSVSARSGTGSIDDHGRSSGPEQSYTDAQSARSSNRSRGPSESGNLDRDLAMQPLLLLGPSTDDDASEGHLRNGPRSNASDVDVSASEQGLAAVPLSSASDGWFSAPHKRRSVSGNFNIPDMPAYEHSLDSAPAVRRSARHADAHAPPENFNQMHSAAGGDRYDGTAEFEVLTGRNETRFATKGNIRQESSLEGTRSRPDFSDSGYGRSAPEASSLATPLKFQPLHSGRAQAQQLDRRDKSMIGEALHAYGQPGEWWHDSIILGRLSALASRYHAVKTTTRPWQAWKAKCQRSRQKMEIAKRNRRQVSLRTWRWRQLVRGKCKNKRPLMDALSMLVRKGLAPAWEKMRNSVFHHRDLRRQLQLLYLAKARAMGELALGHYYRNLLRLGLASFWIAVRLHHNTPRAAREAIVVQDIFVTHHEGGAVARGVAKAEPRSHVAEVLMKTWLRWMHGIRLWVPPALYELRRTEGWLLGENATPRAIVTDPERCDFLVQKYGFVNREGDRSSPQNAQHDEADFPEQSPALELPFPEIESANGGNRVDVRPYQLSAHGLANAVKERIIFMPPKEPAKDAYEKPLAEPPQRMQGLVTGTPTPPASPVRSAMHPPLPSSSTTDRRFFGNQHRQPSGSPGGRTKSGSLISITSPRSDDEVDFMDPDVDDRGRSSAHKSSWDSRGFYPQFEEDSGGIIGTVGGPKARQPANLRDPVDQDSDAYRRLRCRFQSAKLQAVTLSALRPKN